MKINNFAKILLLFIFCISCSKEKLVKTEIKEKNLDLQVYAAYEEGLKFLEQGDSLFAAKKFNEAEILFPQSIWLPNQR